MSRSKKRSYQEHRHAGGSWFSMGELYEIYRGGKSTAFSPEDLPAGFSYDIEREQPTPQIDLTEPMPLKDQRAKILKDLKDEVIRYRNSQLPPIRGIFVEIRRNKKGERHVV